jgi:hypothetical protein
MRKFLGGAGIWIVGSLAWTPFSAGVGVVATFVLRNVSGAHGWWNAWFLFGVFLIATSATYVTSRLGWAAVQQTGPIARLREREAEREHQKRATSRETRIAAQTIRSELLRTKRRLEDALRTQRHWDPEVSSLPVRGWRENAAILAGDEVVAGAYNACRDAYVEVERTNTDNETMWNNTRRNFYDPTPAEYSATYVKVVAAEQELGKLLDP